MRFLKKSPITFGIFILDADGITCTAIAVATKEATGPAARIMQGCVEIVRHTHVIVRRCG